MQTVIFGAVSVTLVVLSSKVWSIRYISSFAYCFHLLIYDSQALDS